MEYDRNLLRNGVKTAVLAPAWRPRSFPGIETPKFQIHLLSCFG